jgi:hypothetical protein
MFGDLTSEGGPYSPVFGECGNAVTITPKALDLVLSLHRTPCGNSYSGIVWIPRLLSPTILTNSQRQPIIAPISKAFPRDKGNVMQASRWLVTASEYSWSEWQSVRRRGRLFFVLIRGTLRPSWLIGIVALSDLLKAGHLTPFFLFVAPVSLFAGYLFAFHDWDELEGHFSGAIGEQSKH